MLNIISYLCLRKKDKIQYPSRVAYLAICAQGKLNHHISAHFLPDSPPYPVFAASSPRGLATDRADAVNPQSNLQGLLPQHALLPLLQSSFFESYKQYQPYRAWIFSSDNLYEITLSILKAAEHINPSNSEAYFCPKHKESKIFENL